MTNPKALCKKLKYIPAILLLIAILTGCAAAVEGDASVTSTETIFRRFLEIHMEV